MQNAGLNEAQAWLKIAKKNINNLSYADDTTLMAESEEEPKSFLTKVKEESEKACLKLNIQRTKIMASGPIASWQIDGRKSGNSNRVYVRELQKMNHRLGETISKTHIIERICAQMIPNSSLKLDKDWNTYLAKEYKQICT